MVKPTHFTQIFLHNPHAMRAEFRVDEAKLILWWSPLAGKSFSARHRNFSNRDDHLKVFDVIHLPGCDLKNYSHCHYDPYHTVLHFAHGALHLAMAADAPVIRIWCDAPQPINIKTQRYDEALTMTDTEFLVSHQEADLNFEFHAQVSAGNGKIRHSQIHDSGNSRYARAELDAGQSMLIGVGLKEDKISQQTASKANQPIAGFLDQIDQIVQPSLQQGITASARYPQLQALRNNVVRGLHSQIDLSGAIRASLKEVYYLIWLRDAAFIFNYKAASGSLDQMKEFCQLLLENPTTAQGDGVATGRLFAQLINPVYGKYEEDGIFYATWSLFTYWTQTGSTQFLTRPNLELLKEAMQWVETSIFDVERGLFGSRFADETPAKGSRDFGWDYAIGKAIDGSDFICQQGQPVQRSYDAYINLCMHSTYSMLAALWHVTDSDQADRYQDKAQSLWKQILPLLNNRSQGLPNYGEMTMLDGKQQTAPPYGSVSSVYVWALTLPSFAPLEDWDTVRGALLDDLCKKPKMHWINGIAAALAANDPWFYPESRLIAMHQRIEKITSRPGKYLPMAGAMPEKFGAKDGDYYHDIRPQAFAMATWLGSWTSLGVRRLPYGLALRATRAFEELNNYPWRKSNLNIQFTPTRALPLLKVNGTPIYHSLQIPEHDLKDGRNNLAIGPGGRAPILLRSTIQLNKVEILNKGQIHFHGKAFGSASLTLHNLKSTMQLRDSRGKTISHKSTQKTATTEITFRHWGDFTCELKR